MPGRKQKGADIRRRVFVVRPSQANDPLELRRLPGKHRAQPRAQSVIVKAISPARSGTMHPRRHSASAADAAIRSK